MGFTSTATVILIIAVVYYIFPSNKNVFSEHRVILSDTIDDEYDYIVVGGGTAGSVVAARISEDKTHKVLLLEAGGFYDEDSRLHTLIYWPELQKTKFDWEYYTTPQTYSSLGFKGQIAYWPRGRVLGGSGMINLAQYTRGSRYDFDEWASNGCSGWSYKEVLPYFLKAEDIQIEELKSSKYHNVGGPMAVSGGVVTQLAHLYMQAGQELGYNITDYNGKDQEGFNKIQINVRNGVRESTAVAYLGRVGKRDNLDIAINTLVTKIGFAGKTANGVYYIRDNKKHFVRARKEVILSAGAINTPQILMLSGVGPKEHLEELDIPVIANLPVGNNLQDHQVLAFFSSINRSISLTPSLMTSLWTILQYKLFGSGPLATAGSDGSAFFYVNDDKRGKSYPEFQVALFSVLMNYDFLPMEEIIQNEYKIEDKNAEGFSFILLNTHPKSRGTLRLRSKDPFDQPILDARYFEEQDDIVEFVKAIRVWEKFVETPTMKSLGVDINQMEKSFCLQHKFRSDAYWECMLRYMAMTSYHLSCTCKMGAVNDQTSVLDPSLRVKGIQGLRVIDASAFPNVTVGNTNTPTVMLAEKGADMIRGIDSVKQLRQNLPDDI